MLQLGGQEAQPGIISKHTLTHRTTEQNQTQNVREHFVVRSAAGKAGRSKGAALRSSRYGAELPHRHPGGASPLSIAHYTHLITHICPPVYTGRRAGRSLAPLDGNRPRATATPSGSYARPAASSASR